MGPAPRYMVEIEYRRCPAFFIHKWRATIHPRNPFRRRAAWWLAV